MTKPELIVHCDWSKDARKRWVCEARLSSDRSYRVSAATAVGPTDSFFARLRGAAPNGSILAGFDFPIGVPRAYAERADVERFPDLLRSLEHGAWTEFYVPATTRGEISLNRPFYPAKPGGTQKQHLVDALGLHDTGELLRRCERKTATRNQACSLFWTLGANQVGRAAIQGWRELLAPAVRARAISLWPFDGELADLLAKGGITVAETYPAETYGHLGLTRAFGKQKQEGRRNQSEAILAWCSRNAVALDPELTAAIKDGFGEAASGEDPFDAFIGALGMIEAVRDPACRTVPGEAGVRQVEGWILGTSH